MNRVNPCCEENVNKLVKAMSDKFTPLIDANAPGPMNMEQFGMFKVMFYMGSMIEEIFGSGIKGLMPREVTVTVNSTNPTLTIKAASGRCECGGEANGTFEDPSYRQCRRCKKVWWV